MAAVEPTAVDVEIVPQTAKLEVVCNLVATALEDLGFVVGKLAHDLKEIREQTTD